MIDGFYLEKNPIADRLCDASTTLIGELMPQPAAANNDTNTELLRRWRNDCKSGRISGLEPLADVMRGAIRQTLIHGDAVFLHSAKDTYSVQLVENREWGINTLGELTIARENTPIPNEAFMLLRFERDGKFRGRSAFYSCLEWLKNIDEIIKNWQASIQTASKIGLVRTTKQSDTDALPPLFNDEVTTTDENGDEQKVKIETQAMAAKMAAAGGVLTLAEGENVSVLGDNRPAPEQMALVEFTIMVICQSYGLPPEVAFDIASLKGASNRLRVAEINQYVKAKREALAGIYAQIWARWVVNQDAYKAAPDSDKAKLLNPTWRGAAALTVDESRSGQNAIALINAGLLTRKDYFAEQGLDWVEQSRQLAIEKQQFASIISEDDTN